jgi:L-amino acid N-acyltransferase YncA
MRGFGAGCALIENLLPRALAAGKHVMIGGIDAANEPSIRFHQRLGRGAFGSSTDLAGPGAANNQSLQSSLQFCDCV